MSSRIIDDFKIYFNNANICSNQRTEKQKILALQSLMRGTLVRMRQSEQIENSIKEFRLELIKLWAQTWTSLNYRAKFWMVCYYFFCLIFFFEIKKCIVFIFFLDLLFIV